MAYDKVVDSAVLDAGLKQIADAIREKGGTSDSMAFPTAMAEAIAAIQAAGGGVKVQSGTVTFAERQNGGQLWARLDFVPRFAAMVCTEIHETAKNIVMAVHDEDAGVCRFASWLQTSPSLRFYGWTTTGVKMSSITGSDCFRYKANIADGGANFGAHTNGANSGYWMGTYYWVAVGE